MTIVVDTVPPGWGKANSRQRSRVAWKASKPYVQVYTTPEYKRFKKAVAVAWFEAGEPRFIEGEVEVEIRTYWNRQRHLDVDVAMGDCDAVIKSTLDGLQDCSCLDDDARVVRVIGTKHHDAERPRVEVDIRPL